MKNVLKKIMLLGLFVPMFALDMQAMDAGVVGKKLVRKKLATKTLETEMVDVDLEEDAADIYRAVMALKNDSAVAAIKTAIEALKDKPKAIAAAKNQIILALGVACTSLITNMNSGLTAEEDISPSIATFDELNDAVFATFCTLDDDDDEATPLPGCEEIVEAFMFWYRMITPMVEAQQTLTLFKETDKVKTEATLLEKTLEAEITRYAAEASQALVLATRKGVAAKKVQEDRLARIRVVQQQFTTAKTLLNAGVEVAAGNRAATADGTF